MEKSTFGQRLVMFRARAKMLQKELASKAGISPTALNYYEKDKREPNVKIISALADALNVTGDDLLGRCSESTTAVAQSQDEVDLLIAYRSLSDQGKEWVRQSMVAAVTTYKKDFFVPDMESAKELV